MVGELSVEPAGPVDIGVVVGSTRPGRKGRVVAEWVMAWAQDLPSEVRVHLIDLADVYLPLFDEPFPPASGKREREREHSRRWAAMVDDLDGFVFVTPEYNHGAPASLKNALDYLFHEWNNKAAGFVSYGVSGGVRAVEQLRLNCVELQMPTVRTAVALNFRDDFENWVTFVPDQSRPHELQKLFDELVPWVYAMQRVRRTRSFAGAR